MLSGRTTADRNTTINVSAEIGLQAPYGISLYGIGENEFLLVVDMMNERIQAFRLNGIPPYNGTTVAGGNGAGSDSHQLNKPRSVWVSKKTGAIYIVDTNNHRIQRWNRGASSGATMTGNRFGVLGSNATMLSVPYGLANNTDETRMYVADGSNGRVQRFDLI